MSEGEGTSRRTFLKVLGAGGAGAAAAACSPPGTTDRLLPYLVDPADVTPGENTAYATVLTESGPEPLGIHAWVRDGRVIQIVGNPDFPTNRGRLSALAQSALQDLYDPDRFRGPMRAGGTGGSATGGAGAAGGVAGTNGRGAESGPAARSATAAAGLRATSWEEALQAAGRAVAAGGAVLLTGGGAAGTRDDFYGRWAEAVGAHHLRWEPLHLEVQREAQRIVHGRAGIPRYDPARADHIVCFGADFLESWLAPVELSAGFARARAIEEGRHAPLVFVGPRLSLTGTNADRWLPARPGTEGLVALAVARLVAEARGGEEGGRVARMLVPYTPERVAERSGVGAGQIRELAREMVAAEHPLALPPGASGRGRAATDAHVAVALLNRVVGATGDTVRPGEGPLRPPSTTLSGMAELAERMASGEVRTLLVAGTNPAYSLPPSLGFGEAMARARLISLSPHPDETAVAADWVLPSHHELEAWGDAEVRPGVRALGQPAMRPVFDTRAREDILLGIAAAAGVDPATTFGGTDFRGVLREAWREKHREAGAPGAFGAWWEAALRRGGWWEEEGTDGAAGGPTAPAPGLAPGLESHAFGFEEGPANGDFDLVVFPTGHLHDGRGANRGWMQELPDPVTKVVWNAWVELHPETARPLGLETGDEVEVRAGDRVLRAPVYLNRGLRPDAVALPLGQGHTAYGRNAAGRGVNPLSLLDGASRDGATGALALAGTRVRLSATGEKAGLVVAQGSDEDHDREIAELMGIGAAREAVAHHEVDLTELVEAAWDSDPESPYRWGMTVDLNACTGCSACVTACYAENNIPVVGEERFAAGREMSWLRVERYHEETTDGGFQTVHQPVMCQHCGDAPCEPVCPVYATYHNPEGLNVQVYNRCVGTRYCSNNCPYKVRRFNWFTYEFPHPLELQLNPDVTAREKGVMEKCSFCVHRIVREKVGAKEEGRLVEDGEVTTACQSACPTGALVFGNLKDPSSRVSEIARGARAYHVLEELNTRPAVTYLRDVTHAEPAHGDGHGGGPAGGEGHAAASGGGNGRSGGRGGAAGGEGDPGAGGSGNGRRAGTRGREGREG